MSPKAATTTMMASPGARATAGSRFAPRVVAAPVPIKFSAKVPMNSPASALVGIVTLLSRASPW
jgi:hypothetical protein